MIVSWTEHGFLSTINVVLVQLVVVVLDLAILGIAHHDEGWLTVHLVGWPHPVGPREGILIKVGIGQGQFRNFSSQSLIDSIDIMFFEFTETIRQVGLVARSSTVMVVVYSALLSMKPDGR